MRNVWHGAYTWTRDPALGIATRHESRRLTNGMIHDGGDTA